MALIDKATGFTKELIEDSLSLWDAAVDSEFIKALINNTMEKDAFHEYMIQDSIYLRYYLKIFAFAMTKAKNIADMQLYYGMLGYVDEGENTTRLNYLKDAGYTDADMETIPLKKSCRDYCNFLMHQGANGSELDIIMAMFPCMIGYQYVWEKVAERNPAIMETYYGPCAADYVNEGYDEYCEYWYNVVNEKVAECSREELDSLKAIFREASLHELLFWQMAGREHE